MIQYGDVNTEGGDTRLATGSHTSEANNADIRRYPASAPAATTRVPRQPPSRYHGAHIEGLEWEINHIVARRRTMWGYQFKVALVNSWILRNKLGNAKRLLQRFMRNGRLDLASNVLHRLRGADVKFLLYFEKSLKGFRCTIQWLTLLSFFLGATVISS